MTAIPGLVFRPLRSVAAGAVLSGTGHRPEKIIGPRGLNGYQEPTRLLLVRFATALVRQLAPREIVSGMAQGWDQALADAAVALGVPFRAFVPCDGQSRPWPPAARRRYDELLALAAEVRIVVPGELTRSEAVAAMQQRNVAMNRASDHVLALWNGTAGGTRNCLADVAASGRSASNAWPLWSEFVRRAA